MDLTRNVHNINEKLYVVTFCDTFLKSKYKNVNFTEFIYIWTYLIFESQKNTFERLIGYISICFHNYYSN